MLRVHNEKGVISCRHIKKGVTTSTAGCAA